MAFEHELTALGASQEQRERSRVARMQRRLRLILHFNAVRAYRSLFLDESGQLKPAAVTVIADIAATAHLGVVEPIAASEGELREFAGRRALALHVLARLDQSGVKMRDLARKLREAESE